jgi:3-isopropylmalate dehydratase small subunit
MAVMAGTRSCPGADLADQDSRHARAAILVAGAKFGSGSSREQAAWALLDFGTRCVIAPGFGEIFAGNANSDGLLPLTCRCRSNRSRCLTARQLALILMPGRAQC